MQADPIQHFEEWMAKAELSETGDSNAMTLATADNQGHVSVRVVLLKEIRDGNFVFYTNLQSPKSKDIFKNPNVALCFHWKSLHRQVRIEGRAIQVADDVADAYFRTRPRESQLGAWASRQSEVMKSPDDLEQSLAFYAEKFDGQDIPRPPHWSGFAVQPKRIEFWTEKPFRLHERHVYIGQFGSEWMLERLYP